MEIKKIDLNKYKREIVVNNDFITIRDSIFPPEAINPSSFGRFHTSGQDTYYAASGDDLAMVECDLDPNKPMPINKLAYNIPEKKHHVFDLQALIDDHADAKEFFYGDYGWDNCQDLRHYCQESQVSGIYYESAKVSGGNNLVFWPLTDGDIDNNWFNEIP